MDKIEGGGSFNICPDTGAVTAQHELDKAAAAAAEAEAKRAAEEAANAPKSASKTAKITPIKE